MYRWKLRATDRSNGIDLDFYGTDASDTASLMASMAIPSSGRAALYVNGDIGIGTTGPLNRLEARSARSRSPAAPSSLANSRSLASAVIHGSSDASPAITFGNIANVSTHYLQNSNFNGSASYDIVLDPYGGNIGIATTSPRRRLDVSGGI